MTHIENIPHILQYGITSAGSPLANPNYVPIGDVQIINTRRNKTVIAADGSRLVLGDYIPFYFWVRMPMLFVVQRGGNFVSKPTRPENIVYMLVRVSDLDKNGIPYYFSDGHAVDSLTTFYPSNCFERVNEILDWNSIKAIKWSGEGVDRDLKRKKQAELLAGADIPPGLIGGFLCYNEASFNRLNAFGINEKKIKIATAAAYYS